jgi:hypothetical protein
LKGFCYRERCGTKNLRKAKARWVRLLAAATRARGLAGRIGLGAGCWAGEKKRNTGPRRSGGEVFAAARARAALAAGPVGSAGWPDSVFLFSFFILKLQIHFGASNKIGKMQIRYRWIRYEKYFNMRLNLGQKYKVYKTKI